MSLVFGLSPALFHSVICPSHVSIEVLSLSSAFEPQQQLWSPGPIRRGAWHGGLFVGIAISAGHQRPSGEPFLCQGYPCFPHTGHDAKCQHIAPVKEGGSPEQEQLPLMKASHRDRCAQTQLITSNFCFFDKAGKGWKARRLVVAMCVVAEVESWKDGFISSLFHRVGSQIHISQMPKSALAVRFNVSSVVMNCFSDELQSS